MSNAPDGLLQCVPLDADIAHIAEQSLPPVDRGGRHLFLVEASRHAETCVRLGPRVLSDEELKRAQSFRRNVDRACYLAAHITLRLILASVLAVKPRQVCLTRESCPACGEPHGRPAVADARVHFSLSRSWDLALLAFDVVPIGVDVEAVPAADLVEFTLAALHPAEAAKAAGLAEADKPGAAARAWTRVEAYLKATGSGTSHRLAGRTSLAEESAWKVADVSVPPGYRAAVAFRN